MRGTRVGLDDVLALVMLNPPSSQNQTRSTDMAETTTETATAPNGSAAAKPGTALVVRGAGGTAFAFGFRAELATLRKQIESRKSGVVSALKEIKTELRVFEAVEGVLRGEAEELRKASNEMLGNSRAEVLDELEEEARKFGAQSPPQTDSQTVTTADVGDAAKVAAGG